MKKKVMGLGFLILFFGIAFGQDQMTQTAFEKLCDSTGLKFEMPKGYQVTDVKKNRDLMYSFAILNEDASMEIRYTIWSLKPALERYKKSLENSNSTMISPNKMYQGTVQANLLNMTSGQMYNIGPFPTQAVKEEFNADAGGSCFFEFDCEFGKGYKYGQFMYLHKDDIADVIVTFMSNNKETHPDLMMVGFHALKFK